MESVEEYLEASEFQKRDAIEGLEEFADEIGRMHGRVIDIGCGPGNVTRDYILPRLPSDAQLVGMDISMKMIRFANKEHSDEKRLSFVNFDIETTELPTNQVKAYDNLLSFYCLHWCKNPRQACQNMFDLLKPGGHALVIFLARYDILDSYLVIREKSQYRRYMQDAENFIPYFQGSNCPREDFKNMLRQTGFDVLHCSVREKSFVFRNKNLMKKHSWAVNPFICRMPDEMRDQFVNDLVDHAVKASISFYNTSSGQTNECSILNKYFLMIAYFKKPDS